MRRSISLLAVAALAACSDADSGSKAPAPSCEVDTDCDDGLDCTVDACVPDERGRLYCGWSIAPGRCFVNGVCGTEGQPRPGDPCLVCSASFPLLWTTAADGTPCDDRNLCTRDDACNAGVCGGVLSECNDDNFCTRDGCEPSLGCTFTPLAGFSCDDGVRCTVDDRCDDGGGCSGAPDPCDDGDPCTVDSCNEVEGCTHQAGEETACEDGDLCTASDTCVDGTCMSGRPTNCDDGNVCTFDTCDPDLGCVHLPAQSPCCIGENSVCDDNNPCTDDDCDPETAACTHTINRAACDDLDPCTSDDICADGVCTAGTAAACDDANDCTDDLCDSSYPALCLHAPRDGGRCDDGIACTTGDSCEQGVCVGDTSDCVCVPDLSSDGVKLTQIEIGISGNPGEGLDVDQDPATCAPDGCSGGIDNTLSVIAGLANEQLASAVSRGDVLLVIGIGPLDADPIEVAVFQAERDPSNASCNVQTQTCDWLVDPSFLDPSSCEPVAAIAASRDGDRLVGGGPGTRLPFAIPFNGAELEVVVANLRIEADITVSGNQVSALTGVLGGAVPKATLIEGLQGLPDDALPISKEAAIGLVDSLVTNDIDTDQDGTKDAASIGIKLVGRDGRIVGVAD